MMTAAAGSLGSIDAIKKELLQAIDHESLEKIRLASKEFSEGAYAYAWHHYEAGRYQEAYDLFVLLAALRNGEKKIWMGLGATAQMLKRYQEATEAYSVAAHLDEELKDPYPHFHAAECFYTVGDVKNAWRALEGARKVADSIEGEDLLKSRIQMLRKSWYPQAKALAKKVK